MTDGLLYVLSEPGQVPEAEFHDWYDREHAPARMSLRQFRRGERLRAADDRKPSWLAWYELDLAVLDTPEYRALREHPSAREQHLVSRLETIERRVYELVDDHRRADDDSPPPIMVSLARTSDDEDALDDWYLREQLPLLRDTPGWRRTVRARLVSGAGPSRITVHELDQPAVFDTAVYRQAVLTPLRERVMRTVTEQERRVFRHHRTLSSPA
jgi:hypothetical protein